MVKAKLSLVTRLTAGFCSGLFLVAPALAQRAPDAGTLLRGLGTDTVPRVSPPLATPQVPPEGLPLPQRGQGSVFVREIRVEGSTHFNDAELRAVVADYFGRDLTLADLEAAALAVADYYRQHDLLARAWLPEQAVRDGVVTIRVLEGRFGQVDLDASTSSRLSADIARNRILYRAPVGEPLRPSAVDEAVAVLNETPGVVAKAALKPGRNLGETDVALKLEDMPLVSGLVMLDNAGTRSTGSARALGAVSLNNALGVGDQATINAVRSQYSTYGRLALSVPVHESGLTLGVNGAKLDYSLGESFTALDADGYAYTAGLTASYPIRRQQTFALTAMAGYDHKRLVNRALDIRTSDTRINAINAGLATTVADDWLGGGINQGSLTLLLGRADLAANAGILQTDQSGPKVNGNYGKLLLSAARAQKLDDDTELGLSVAGQWSGRNLDSSEKFALGGSQGVRAYPSTEANGDEGAVAQLELRGRIDDSLQVAGFADSGVVRLNKNAYADWQSVEGQPNIYWLHGIGVWVAWKPLDNLMLRGVLAQAIGPNPGHDANGNDSDGLHRRPRVWLSAVLSF